MVYLADNSRSERWTGRWTLTARRSDRGDPSNRRRSSTLAQHCLNASEADANTLSSAASTEPPPSYVSHALGFFQQYRESTTDIGYTLDAMNTVVIEVSSQYGLETVVVSTNCANVAHSPAAGVYEPQLPLYTAACLTSYPPNVAGVQVAVNEVDTNIAMSSTRWRLY